MQGMDVLVFPSLYEGLGLVLVEAQCSGLHCVMSTGVPEETVLVEEICDRIELGRGGLEWKKKSLRKYKRKNFSFILKEKKYSIKDEVKKIEQIYINLFEKNI